MNQALQSLYRLWHQPGPSVDPAWWEQTGLSQWSSAYERHPLTRPDLDLLLRQRLDLEGMPPELTAVASELLVNGQRRQTLMLALGLWAMEAGALLLIRAYRDALSGWLDNLSLGQLQILLPYNSSPLPDLAPEALPGTALGLGTAWLEQVSDPALRACRLFFPPSGEKAPEACPLPVLQKLVRWL
ncbi:type III secretion system domain-containing protein [Aeromonas jandaei]|uniref:type III secretion system domain-containing protein n=1 Tax=Aeromonas jandaei TaxID=650 RepID=UPI0011175892|nr:type III secretion system domain-containing protein [Aeromonas jandaei]TNI02974.1 hypothetical protein CF104_09415 [Aeromonas jandaei]